MSAKRERESAAGKESPVAPDAANNRHEGGLASPAPSAHTPSVSLAGIAELRRVQQEDRAGCGIACLAMVTGRSYADVRESVLASGAETREFMEQMLASCGSGAGITERKVLWWLNREGYFTRVTWRPVNGEAVLPPRGTAILLADSEPMGGHFIVLHDGRFLDPAHDPPAARYAVRQVIEVIRHAAADSAARLAGVLAEMPVHGPTEGGTFGYRMAHMRACAEFVARLREFATPPAAAPTTETEHDG